MTGQRKSLAIFDASILDVFKGASEHDGDGGCVIGNGDGDNDGNGDGDSDGDGDDDDDGNGNGNGNGGGGRCVLVMSVLE